MSDPTPPVMSTTRQIARILTFDALHAPHVNYASIGAMAAELGCHWDVRRQTRGVITITLFWEEPKV